MGFPMMLLFGLFIAFALGRRRRYWYDRHAMHGRVQEGRPLGDGRYGPGVGRDDYIEMLEARIANLEERLDFTEELVARRRIGERGAMSETFSGPQA